MLEYMQTYHLAPQSGLLIKFNSMQWQKKSVIMENKQFVSSELRRLVWINRL